ncbi:H-2 class II histocompatibility antigen, E-S beta chain-like [Chanos chanos]|uniref:H-2 class II histocompatibility antigen, E-S beta chain-like n=1 Tax=Chanos chanos TaxID=29144 RepID=A0A6J2UMX3_CHACN|nr:H-2 class II histocompatibility antigen, E-S beta chain-like [Chanos chanos]
MREREEDINRDRTIQNIIYTTVFTTAHSNNSQLQFMCIYSSPDLSDMEYLQINYFNKVKHAEFSSTVGKFVGFTKQGWIDADYWNNNTAFIQQLRGGIDRYCRHNARISFSTLLDKTASPKVRVRSIKKGSGTHPAVLMCSASRFYPKAIKLTWLKDSKPVTSDVTSTEEMADGDWYYQVHSHLEHIPKSGEKISCMVEHASFAKPMTYDLEPSVSESDTNKIAIGASGLVLGVILAAAGLVYYKKKSTGRILVPH